MGMELLIQPPQIFTEAPTFFMFLTFPSLNFISFALLRLIPFIHSKSHLQQRTEYKKVRIGQSVTVRDGRFASIKAHSTFHSCQFTPLIFSQLKRASSSNNLFSPSTQSKERFFYWNEGNKIVMKETYSQMKL